MSEIRVTVRFFNILASYAGTKKIEVSFPDGATLQRVIDHLVQTGSQELRQILVNNGKFNQYLKIFHNEQLVSNNELERPIKEGDEILIFPAIAGG